MLKYSYDLDIKIGFVDAEPSKGTLTLQEYLNPPRVPKPSKGTQIL